jgi:hypothetical protein
MAEGFVPPQEVRANAKRGLELRKEHGRGGTEIGVARARDLSNGSAVSLDTVKRMVSYFARHEVDKQGEGWGVDSAGYIAWLLWGGDAGRSWAKRIVKEQEAKEKSTVKDLTTAFFEIVKSDKRDDGTLMVYGKATDDSLDIDQQICDPAWLDQAMPEWFKTGGNIREQHSSIAAGVAKEYEKKADGHYIHALVVDPISVKKVDTGVLKGFSIVIKSPRIVRDTKAANGRIIDGQIVEVSLVDRPANPNCQLVLAKSAEGQSGMWKVEELIEKAEAETDYESINVGRGNYEPADSELYNRVKAEAKEKFDVYPSAVANAWVVQEYKKRGGTYKKIPKSFLSDLMKFDKTEFIAARDAIANLIANESSDIKEGHDEISSLRNLLEALEHLHGYYEGAKLNEEISEEDREILEPEEIEEELELSTKPEETKEQDDEKMRKTSHEEKVGHEEKAESEELEPIEGETEDEFKARCKEAGMEEDKAAECYAKYMSKKEKSANKCLECGCHSPEDAHGRSDVSTADLVSPSETPKSAEPTEEVKELEDQELPDKAEEISEGSDLAEEIQAIVEKAIKSATESLKSEIAELANAKEAAANKAVGLESELAVAKSLAVAGGPKRTIKPVDHSTNDLLVKAATYKAKADASTDPDLMKGYKLLAEKYFAEADTITKSN